MNPKLNPFRLKSYRQLARPKQLPPDTPNWYETLRESINPNTGRPDSDSVFLVREDAQGKPSPICVSSLPHYDGALLHDFFIWMILCGRGFGKSWVGSSWINEGAEKATGQFMGLLGRDAHDVRAFMIEGDSGILRTAKPDFYPKYEPSKRLITWPNGVAAQIYYAEEPNTVRGPNNFRAWVDEPASFQDAGLGLKGPNGEDTAMSNLLMTLRIGDPQLLITGTPKPYKLIKDLMKYFGIIIVRGGTRENSGNLSKRWLGEMEKTYEGTGLGRQELDGELLDDNPGALWRRTWIDQHRVARAPLDMDRVGVAIDPMGSTGSEHAETGIITAGRSWNAGEERYHFYVTADDSVKGSPKEWATAGVDAYNEAKADVLVAEKNFGGDMVTSTVQSVDQSINVQTVWASRGKVVRAEPVSALYEQGRVHHVGDPRKLEILEDELCNWDPSPQAKMPSPNRLDALVWILTELNESGHMEASEDDYKTFWGNSLNDF